MASLVTRAALLTATALASAALFAAPACAQTAPAATTSTAAPTATGDRSVKPLSDDIAPSWGKIRTFWGDNTPFWGKIRSFWGDTGPYADDLTPFWGKIRTFNDTNLDSSLYPQWGKIRTFAGDIGASWGNIRTFWSGLDTAQTAPDYSTLAGMLSGMVSQSRSAFGDSVQAQTGQSFDAAFANPMLAKYGIDLNNPQSLAALDPNTREHFFLDWWDGLMNYSGADHVDHWMKEVNWSPSLTQQVGMSGTNSTIGILDFSITGASANSVVKYGGISTVANGHGAAVASLIVDPMDGKGVMGIAPSASVIAYNPFDATQTAGWSDITNGVAMLTKNGATIINMSLGVPGWTLNPGWDAVFQSPLVKPTAAKQVFVVAAGNDGVVQTANVPWHPDNPQLLIVGSVDPTGTISSFSNQPGTACFTDPKGNCMPGGRLMDHFIVAPGEMILVSDGQGGVTRMSGTSFAAPLVSGTIALIQDRWPWLTAHPKDVAGIILGSARDLGAPGTDPVYGVGELDVLAALSPLDWSKLTYKQVTNGVVKTLALKDIQATTAAQRSTWEANSVYFSLFEDTGESNRDFQVPMSTKLANQTVSIGGSPEQFMSYLTSRFTTWINTAPTGPVPPAPKFALADGRFWTVSDLAGVTQRFAAAGGAEATLTMRPHVNRLGFKPSEVPFDSAMRIVSPNQRFAAEFGNGDSAATLGGSSGFGLSSDYDLAVGGANPFLGLASGGGYGRVQVALAPGLTVASGFTQRSLARDLNGLPLAARAALGGATPYRASAANLQVSYQPTSRLTTSFGYTSLHEGHAVLGMGSSDASDLPGGSTTDAATVGADWAVGGGVSLAASATAGRTRAGDPSQNNLAIGRGGLISSAFQVALGKDHLFGRRDNLRVTFAQPLHVERGTLDVQTVQVVDRMTGEIGVVTQHAEITAPNRRYVAEMIYGRSMMDGAAQISLFGRANLRAQASDALPGVTAGTSFRLSF